MKIFLKRKESILSKKDKSSKGDWDEKILSLCESINKTPNMYTTSSCSGRVVILLDRDKKGPGVFYWVSHDKITFSGLKKKLNSIKDGNPVKFKQEPCILHVACDDFNAAASLLRKAQTAGWKRSGIISHKKKFVCELLSTEKLEFPIIDKGKILVDDNFLKIVVKKSNSNLKKTWDKIEKLNKFI